MSSGDSDFEPDAVVNCGAPIEDGAIALPNPVVVVEVLSPKTQSVDTGMKLGGYFAVPSVQHCLIVHPTRRMVIHHRRSAAGDGTITTRIAADGPISLDPPGLMVDVASFYV